MDSGTAVVVGALVAFGGSFLGSVVAPWINEGRAERRALRTLRFNETRRLCAEIINALAAYRSLSTTSAASLEALRRFMTASTELGMLLEKKDGEIHELVGWLGEVVSRPTGPRSTSASAMGNTQVLLGEWFRREIPATGIVAEAKRRVDEEVRAMAAASAPPSSPAPGSP